MYMRNLHTTTCNLLLNFTTSTHFVSFKFTSRLQVYSFTKFSHICTEFTQCLYAVTYAQIDTLSLSLCTLDTPCVHAVSCNLIFCCVIQNDDTPLFRASFRGHTEIVVMLLKFGADFSSCDTVSTSYFITPISAVSEYLDVYTYVNIDPCIVTLGARMYSEGYCTLSVCLPACLSVYLSFSTYSCATGTKPAHE